jgi:aminoglycoside phosphotransferase (APT) family kinase protein
LAGTHWTLAQVSAALAGAGFGCDPGALELLPRDDRLLALVPGERLAWFPQNEAGRALLGKERRVLRLLERYCRFAAPRVLYEDDAGWDVRRKVSGVVDPPELWGRIQSNDAFAHALGRQLGMMIAEQHQRVPSSEIEGWLTPVVNWPRAEDLPFLQEVTDDAPLRGRMQRALRDREELQREVTDRVLIHGDLGPHNIVVDPVTYRVAGLIDYEGAAYGDRTQDFVYLVLQRADEPMLEGAIDAYQSITGVAIDRGRVRLLNAVAAIGFLAFRHGHPPEEVWCGRTLDEDLAWTRAALSQAGL